MTQVPAPAREIAVGQLAAHGPGLGPAVLGLVP